MSSLARQHYVYLHRRATDGKVFYVGKGKDRRAWASTGRNRYWKIIVRKHGFSVEIVRDKLPEHCALSLERAVVIAIGKDKLANQTDGGGGICGWKHSPEVRAKIAEAGKGRKLNANQLKALRDYNANRVISDETKRRQSIAASKRERRPHSAETRAKIAASHIGMKPSAETLRKLSIAKIGKAVGRDSPTYDHTVRHWRHDDGRTFSGTRAEIIKQFSLGDSCVSAVIRGRQKQVKGWRLI